VPQRFIPELIAWHRKGLFPCDCMVRLYDFDDINREVADARRGETIKPVLRIADSQVERHFSKVPVDLRFRR
jgi:aryl-alcohol dehydrogenase